MLINCPECELQVSDKALSCPHCGYPLKPEAAKPRKRRTNKRKRLPNGFGQITELKGRALRKPFRAMVTVGKTPEGKPICKLLRPEAYFQTYNEAYAALLEYNKNPFDFSNDITMRELYDRWSTQFYPKLKSTQTYKMAWLYCTSIYDIPVREIHIKHVRHCMYDSTAVTKNGVVKATPNVQSIIKTLLSKMFDYAIEYEIVEKNPARSFRFGETLETKRHHIDFTDDEMQTIWANINTTPYIDILVIQCYTGMRPQEIGNIMLENVFLEDGYFVGGMKTKSGQNRSIPIHHKIMPFIKRYYDDAVAKGSKYLFNYTAPCQKRSTTQLSYQRYAAEFNRWITDLNLNPEHKPHDGRLQFVTQAKKAKVDEYAIKRIVGHTISDITEAIYTKRDISWLKEEIEKIP